jgi:starch-binding outer membrane protein, SusD/RagB family
MKTVIKSLAVTATVLLAGCEKYLDKPPIGILTEKQIQDDPTVGTLTGGVTNAYVPLASTLNLFGDWNWSQGLVLRNDFIVEDIASGDVNKKWNPDGDQAWMDDVAAFNFTSENGAFNGLWTYDYEGISRANLSISQLANDAIVQQTGIAPELADRLLGEAYFLRAFYYFNLVGHFGDVPLLLKPLANFQEAYEVARRAPASEVWAQIDADLSAAAGLLPAVKYAANDERWRASHGAVLAMQAKSALYQKRWQEVVDKVGALETLGFYTLNAHYFDAFDTSKEFNENEVIFAYDHRTAVQPRRGNGLTALLGWGFIAPSNDFLAEFEANDPRRDYTVNTADQAVYKLLGGTNTDNKGNDDSPINKIYIRWADVLLWKAEAYNELNSPAQAIALINQVRQRARTTAPLGGGNLPVGTLPARDGTATKAQVQQWLDHERRVELGFESHRFSDLRRWGTAKTVLTAMGKNFQDRHYLYPIPQGEVDKSAGTITQNQGY